MSRLSRQYAHNSKRSTTVRKKSTTNENEQTIDHAKEDRAGLDRVVSTRFLTRRFIGTIIIASRAPDRREKARRYASTEPPYLAR